MKVSPVQYRLNRIGQNLKQIEFEINNLKSLLTVTLDNYQELTQAVKDGRFNVESDKPAIGVLAEDQEAEPYDGLG